MDAPSGTKSLTKSELIEVVAQEANLTKGRAELVVNTIFDAMVQALGRGEGIEIRGFGSFTVRQYKSYEGRNPRTGDTVHVPPKCLPFFKVGKELRERVNGIRSTPEVPEAVARRQEARIKARVGTRRSNDGGGGGGDDVSEDVI